EAGAAPQHARRMPVIADRVFDPRDTARVAAFLLAPFDAADLEKRRSCCLLGRETARHARFDESIDMELQLSVELVLDARSLEERSEAQPRFGDQSHRRATIARLPSASR